MSSLERPSELASEEVDSSSFSGLKKPSPKFPSIQTIGELVSSQARKNAGSLALVSSGVSIAYGDLERQSNQLAHYLRTLGVGPETLVGLCLERSPAMVVAALAVIKAGGAYVPFDPGYPAERLAYMLEDSQAAILITRESLSGLIPKGPHSVLEIERHAAGISKQAKTPPPVLNSRSDPAYAIYTSGSDGNPKGVLITHDGLLNLVGWHQRAFAVVAGDRASQVASMSFDAAVWEIWPYIAAGASVHICDDMARMTAASLQAWMVAQEITIGFAPTALAEGLMALAWPDHGVLRILLTGADMLHRRPPASLPFTVVNNYGPTECTVVATSGVVSAEGGRDHSPSIGNAIDNVEILILDEKLSPLPNGATGEICIGGAGLARGYLHRPDLDREKFIAHPFACSGERLYRTGDLGRLAPSGEIEFVGRLDNQLKIRGYRVEPNEIIAMLDEHPGVQASVVIARDDVGENKRLVAYLVPEAGADLNYGSLLEFSRERVPDYMVPGMFIRIDALPLNHNGKVDGSRLPKPDPSNIVGDDAAAQTPTEEKVAAILAQLLGVTHIAAGDNFFFLGGHSLLGTQLIARLRDRFGVELSLRTIFDSPTAAELANKIDSQLE